MVNEEEIIAKAVGQQEARQAQRCREEQEKKAAMQKAIAEHRETMVRPPEASDES